MGDDDSPKSGQFDWSKFWIFLGATVGVGLLIIFIVYASKKSKGSNNGKLPNNYYYH